MSRLLIRTTLLLGLALCVALLSFVESVAIGDVQTLEKSLEIERHANEPYEIVDLRVGDQALTRKIKPKYRRRLDNREGLDTVVVPDTDNWFNRLKITVKNTSNRKIVGLQSYLYFKPSGSQVLFSVTLKGSRQLNETVLEPGDKVDIQVDPESWNRTASRLKTHGLEVNSAEVTLSIENVAFSDDLMWNGGHWLQRSRESPNRWVPLKSRFVHNKSSRH